MKMGDFASEYDSLDLPAIPGDPMANQILSARVDALPLEDRVEQAVADMLGGAVYQYYFAKRVHPQLVNMAAAESGPLGPAIEVLDSSLVKQAVIGIASTIDLTTGRTNSLPHALAALEAELRDRLTQAFDPETQATVELLQHIRARTNPDVVPSLKYVRHLRNKWAGHSSLDRSVDSWAQADSTIHFALLEDALARMVNAFQDLGTLTPMSPELQRIEAQGHASQVQPDGTEVVRARIAWTGANALAVAMREVAQKGADALLQRLAHPS